MIEFPYDDAYQPPAPLCQVSLSVARTGQSVGPLDAILDTGADGTLVPQRYLETIGARRVMETGLRSQWGNGVWCTSTWSHSASVKSSCPAPTWWATIDQMKS